MTYKLQKFTSVYPDFIGQFLADNPDYESLSFARLYERFVASHYGWSNYYAQSLNALGYDAQDIFVNIGPLQKSWADERGVKYSRNAWQKNIVLAQVKSFSPDVLFLQDLHFFDRPFRQHLREVCGKRILMIGWQAGPTEDFGALKDLDLLLTCAPHFAEYMRQAGANAALLLHAFEPSILACLPRITERDLDFTFAGSLVLRDGFHQERYRLVRHLIDSTPLLIWGEIIEAKSPPKRARLLSPARAVARHLKNLELSSDPGSKPKSRQQVFSRKSLIVPPDMADRNRFRASVFGLRYYEILARSKVALNSHIDCAEQTAGNMRLFEATGTGACLLTDRKSNLSELFQPDVEVATYGSREECAEKVKFLLTHDEERKAIGAAGQRRVMRDHTFEQRAVRLDNLIRQAFHKLRSS